MLDDDTGETIGTSIRLPANLRDAAAVATQMGLTSSTSELTVRGLRDACWRRSLSAPCSTPTTAATRRRALS